MAQPCCMRLLRRIQHQDLPDGLLIWHSNNASHFGTAFPRAQHLRVLESSKQQHGWRPSGLVYRCIIASSNITSSPQSPHDNRRTRRFKRELRDVCLPNSPVIIISTDTSARILQPKLLTSSGFVLNNLACTHQPMSPAKKRRHGHQRRQDPTPQTCQNLPRPRGPWPRRPHEQGTSGKQGPPCPPPRVVRPGFFLRPASCGRAVILECDQGVVETTANQRPATCGRLEARGMALMQER